MGHFPVAGPADYTDDWRDARFGPPFHLHQGTDIFADRGTPVIGPRATASSRFSDGGLGGKGAYVTTADGTYYYFAHLDAYADSVYSGAAVEQGQVIGTSATPATPRTGRPTSTSRSTPAAAAAVNPKPILDGWLAEALDAVPALLAAYGVNVPRAVTAAGVLRRFDEGGLAGSGRPPEGALLWASSVSAGGGTLRLAEVAGGAAGRAASTGTGGPPTAQAAGRRPAGGPGGGQLGARAPHPAAGGGAARARASVPEVLELQGDAEVVLLEGGDHRLEVVALLARHPHLLALGLRRHALGPRAP